MFSLATLTLFVCSALATTVSYDRTYDNSAASLDTVACSDGPNGLEHLGYTTFGSLPDYPYIGGSSDVAGWGSTSCTPQGPFLLPAFIDVIDRRELL